MERRATEKHGGRGQGNTHSERCSLASRGKNKHTRKVQVSKTSRQTSKDGEKQEGNPEGEHARTHARTHARDQASERGSKHLSCRCTCGVVRCGVLVMQGVYGVLRLRNEATRHVISYSII